jgi:hypothetical protein
MGGDFAQGKKGAGNDDGGKKTARHGKRKRPN